MKNEELENKDILPTGWTKVQWESITDIKNGKHYINVLNENGKYPIYGSAGIINYADEYLCNEDTVIVGRKGTINKPLFVKEKFWNIDTAFGIESNHEVLNPLYLYYFCLNFDFMKLNQSTAIPSLTKSNLQKIFMPLAPLNEQKRIVAKIEKLFSNLDNSDKYLLHLEKQLKRYRQSVLKSAFEGEYKKIQWNEVTNIINGKHYTDVVNENGKYPIYGSAGIINYADEYLCNEDTVIVGRKGTINKPLFVKEKFWNIDTAFGIEANKERLAPMYLYYFSLSFNFLELNQSTTIPSLTKSNLLKINMPLPDTLDEQQEIVNQIEKHFSIIDKLETVVQQSIKESKRLRQSILKQAFEGKLVEQDPNDESASVLLEKIAKAKEEYLKAQKKQVRKK